MSAMARQWVIDSMAGQVLSLRLEALPAVLSCLAIEPSPTLLAQIQHDRLQHVIAAHLSEENNRPDLARAALAAALGCAHEWIGVASQDSGFDWRQLG